MNNLEISGIPGCGKSYLILNTIKNYNKSITPLSREKYYKNKILRLVLLPIVIVLYRKIISEIYQKRRTGGTIKGFLSDYVFFLFCFNNKKDDRAVSTIYILFTAAVDMCYIFIMELRKINFIMEEGIIQKGYGLLLRNPHMDVENLIENLVVRQSNKIHNIIISPANEKVHKMMMQKRSRGSSAIRKWTNDQFNFDDLVALSLSFFNRIDQKNIKLLTRFINSFDDESTMSFQQLMFDKMSKNFFLIVR